MTNVNVSEKMRVLIKIILVNKNYRSNINSEIKYNGYYAFSNISGKKLENFESKC